MNVRDQFISNLESSHPANINYFASQIVYLSTLKDSIVDSDKYKLHRQDFHLQQSVWEIEDWTFNFRQIIERKYNIDNFEK